MKVILTIILLGLAFGGQAQVAITNDATPPDPSAMLDIKGIKKGLLVPRMTAADRSLIASPAHGLMIYQTDGVVGYYYNTGTPASPVWSRLGDISLPYSGNIAAVNQIGFSVQHSQYHAIQGYATAATGMSMGLLGWSESNMGIGTYGKASSATGQTSGVLGIAFSDEGKGVHGTATSATGNTYGVYGSVSSPTGKGVYGINTASTGFPTGVYGEIVANQGYGVYGRGYIGVYGRSEGQVGYGVVGWSEASSGQTWGVAGESKSTSGTGVSGGASATTGKNYGVYGISLSNEGTGVYGIADNVAGLNYGVRGETKSAAGYGVLGIAPTLGIVGKATATATESFGVTGISYSENYGAGVKGFGASDNGVSYGVYGESTSYIGYGVYGKFSTLNSAGGGAAIFGEATGSNSVGVYGKGGYAAIKGEAENTQAFAGHFLGKFFASGNVGFGSVDNPAYTLHVSKNVSDNWLSGFHNTNTSTTAHGVVIRADGGDPLAVQYKSSNILYVSKAGHVGVGTTVPSYNLHVISGAEDWAAAVHNYNSLGAAHGLLVRADGGTPFMVQDKTAISRMIVTQNGNIGISESNPEYRLVVNAAGTASTGIAAFRNSIGENKVILRQNSDGSGAVHVYNAENATSILLRGSGGASYINSGNVGIGTASPAYLLQVGAAADGSQARANAWNTFSDARYKKDFEHIEDPLGMVDRMTGYYYHWNTGTDSKRQIGFSAQELQQVLPEVVSAGADGYLGVDYGKLTTVLVEALKAMQQKHAQLQQEVQQLKAMIQQLSKEAAQR